MNSNGQQLASRLSFLFQYCNVLAVNKTGMVPAIMLSSSLLGSEELVAHGTAHLSRIGARLPLDMTFRLGRAMCIPWLQDKCHRLRAREEQLVPVITPLHSLVCI